MNSADVTNVTLYMYNVDTSYMSQSGTKSCLGHLKDLLNKSDIVCSTGIICSNGYLKLYLTGKQKPAELSITYTLYTTPLC